MRQPTQVLGTVSTPDIKILLITFSFPPTGGVGVLRALSLAKYLPESGVRVDVLTAANAPGVGRDIKLLQQVPADVTVHRTWTLDLPFAVRKAIKKFISGRGTATAAPATPNPAAQAPARPSLLKRIVGNLLLPDPQIGWLPFALPAAKRIIRQRGIQAVVITVPPFSTVKLVAGLKRAFPALPVIVDFRDEWLTTTLKLVSFNDNERARRIASETEREAVHHATAVVAVTDAAREELISRYPDEPREKFVRIYNGYDVPPPSPTQAVASADNAGLVTLTYIGTVYGSTDPSSFVEAVLGLPQALRARLRVRFIGRIETDAYRARLQQLGETVELKGFVPQAEALDAIRNSDYLLLITHDRINVSAKFYDYLGAGRPILAAVAKDGDVRRLVEQTGVGRWADVESADSIRAMLAAILDPANPTAGVPYAPDYAAIAGFHRRALTMEYAALLRRLTS